MKFWDGGLSCFALKPSINSSPRELVYRIPLLVRMTHWLIAFALLVLLVSGLQIFNAHPSLYWGSASKFDRPFLDIGSAENASGEKRGYLRLGSRQWDTTGVLGLSKGGDGQADARAFPHWILLPSYQSLGDGRRWHFFFAWCLALGLGLYFVANFIRGRLRRDLLPTGRDVRGIGRSVLDHLKFRFSHGARHYNVLQKIAYLSVMFGLVPLVILTGLALSPGFDAAAPWLLILCGGRQSARSLHFLGTFALVLFVFVHVFHVIAAGPINEMRSIITGWFFVREPAEKTTEEGDLK
ncbi:MAG: cytochrome b/b6 domain-containing protein [Verrucomicrobiota bacterium]